MLARVNFFKSLGKVALQRMGALMEVVYLPVGEVVFEEGDPGTEMYILIDGAVEMHKKRVAKNGLLSWDTVARSITTVDESTHRLAEYNARSQRPWFGEIALWSSRTRAATAICTEPVKMLVLQRPNFPTFLALAPTFVTLFSNTAKSYDEINELKSQRDAEELKKAAQTPDSPDASFREQQTTLDTDAQIQKQLEASEGLGILGRLQQQATARTIRREGSHSTAAQRFFNVVKRWEVLTSKLLHSNGHLRAKRQSVVASNAKRESVVASNGKRESLVSSAKNVLRLSEARRYWSGQAAAAAAAGAAGSERQEASCRVEGAAV